MLNTSSQSNATFRSNPLPSSKQIYEITDQDGDKAFPIHVVNRAFEIEEKYHTEVVRIVFADKIVFMISQLDALAGTIIKADKDNSNALTMTVSQNYDDFDGDFNQLPEPTYSVRTLFGKRAPSLENAQSETYLDVETIFARLLIEELYKPKERSTMQIPDLLEPPMPIVLEKPLIICLTFSKEFQNRLKQPKIGKQVMKQLIDCVVNKI
ncbi:hypothetical protein C9374_002407 [Naegleria lovaniensis]|uniref:Uncharacterized protein n=1 Tax=Naegleria lovaniensis TaxID=51637 RepID=A0AA88KLI5_NAELO|nr:uncharacterized protein C9374_002407 [Naegleria lovaniensis]KAG2386663.1 hypothetical protein C9374_002407 [Naegleria lovaniensis]